MNDYSFDDNSSKKKNIDNFVFYKIITSSVSTPSKNLIKTQIEIIPGFKNKIITKACLFFFTRGNQTLQEEKTPSALKINIYNL